MWLRDLLPFDIDVPSRIFIYGCDSPVEKSDNNSSVLDYARELLNGVSSSLQSEEVGVAYCTQHAPKRSVFSN